MRAVLRQMPLPALERTFSRPRTARPTGRGPTAALAAAGKQAGLAYHLRFVNGELPTWIWPGLAPARSGRLPPNPVSVNSLLEHSASSRTGEGGVQHGPPAGTRAACSVWPFPEEAVGSAGRDRGAFGRDSAPSLPSLVLSGKTYSSQTLCCGGKTYSSRTLCRGTQVL